jgi:tetratricopeptide (TPR) repeat protein
MATAPDPPPPAPPAAPPRGPARPPWRGRVLLVLLLLAGLSAAAWRYRVTRPEYRLARGEEAVRAEQWDQARDYIDKLATAGHADEAHLLRGEFFYARGQFGLALEEFDAVRPASPLRARAMTRAGRCLLDLGALREAHGAFASVVERDPDNADARRGLAAVAYDLGQFGTAIEHLEVVARLDPADGRPHRLVGRINKDMGQHEKAEAAYREALRRGLPDPVAGQARVELAESLLALNRFADALAALGEEPAEDAARTAARAEALRGVGRAAEAVELLDRGVARFPAAPLHRLRGQIALDAGDHAGALGPLERAAELAPADYRSHLLLAQVYTAVGRPADAKRAAARAEELRRDLDQITALSRRAIEEPWNGDVRQKLAELSDRLGMPEVARTWRAAAAACAAPPR